LHDVKKSSTFQLDPWQHWWQVVPAAQRVRRGQHGSTPHAVMPLRLMHWRHVVPSPHTAPSVQPPRGGGAQYLRESDMEQMVSLSHGRYMSITEVYPTVE
jgi:hypothetical protein